MARKDETVVVEPLRRETLMEALRVRAAAYSYSELQAIFPGWDVRQLRSAASSKNPLSWDRVLLCLGRLGYDVEFKVVTRR